jgi:hypothetical protein
MKRLSSGDPAQESNTVSFNYGAKEWVTLTRKSMMVTINLYEQRSNLILRDSAEGIALAAKIQENMSAKAASQKKIATGISSTFQIPLNITI